MIPRRALTALWLSGLVAGCKGESIEDHAIFTFETRDPHLAPADPLAGTDLESCSVFEERRCVDDVAQACALYDPVVGAWVTDTDELLVRTLRFERWYDLYHAPDGQTVERQFNAETLPGTPEEVWGSLDHFTRYDGLGDAAIWTGTALNAHLLRYLQTGTEADYQRMEDKARTLVTLFDVTGVPGYLARYHYQYAPDGAPLSDRHIVRYGDELDHSDHPITADVPDLPDDYDTLGTGSAVVDVIPHWRGNPSIDQYTGATVSLPAVIPLLRDAELAERATNHLVCYLNRLERVEIVNLQDNPDAHAALQSLLAGTLDVQLDDEDLDIANRDVIVGYTLRQLNGDSIAAGTFDPDCPAQPQLHATRVLDAASSSFVTELIGLALDMDSDEVESPDGIDHFYVPSLRGADAIHLMHLAAIAWHFTGDEVYEAFLEETLQEQIGTIEVAHTLGAFQQPAWCHTYYGNHIAFSPLWAFLELLDDSPLRAQLQLVMHQEAWERDNRHLDNAKFNLMYAGVVPPAIGTGRPEAIVTARQALYPLGGNGDLLHDPRRAYTRPYADVVAQLEEDIEPTCPTEEERAACEDGFEFLGITISGTNITSQCIGSPGECPLDGGGCTQALASEALPVALRRWSDVLWQRSPFEIGENHDLDGYKQSPGLDLIEAYWLARHYGIVQDGQGHVLAWQDQEACP